MQCNSCLAQLPPGTTTCPRCGAPTPYNTATPVPNDSTTDAIPIEYGWPGGASAPPSGVPQQQYPASSGQGPQPSYPGWQPPPFMAGQQPAQSSLPNMYQPSYVPPQLPPKRRGFFSGATILLMSLAVLMLLSGVGLIYYTTVFHPAQLKAQATATTQAIQATQVRGTAIANAQATGTAVANANATATAQAQATAQAVATVTAQQAIYSQATSGAPALNDPLTGQDGNSWDQFQTVDNGGCAFIGGTLHASVFTANRYVPCAANATNFRNFTFQVQMKIVRGDSGGVFFRANGNAANGNTRAYIFLVSRDGTYSLFLTNNTAHSVILMAGSSDAINTTPNHTNLITVIARGSSLYLYINRRYAANVSDPTYKSGQIGILAVDSTKPTDVAFSNAKVWTL